MYMYICHVCTCHGMSHCSFPFPLISAVGKGTEVCPSSLSVHAAIQQEEVRLGTTGWSPRYVHTHVQYSGANFSQQACVHVHMRLCTHVFTVRCSALHVFSIHDACSGLVHCLFAISAALLYMYNVSSRID